jgi:hypothetical protein
MRTGVRGCKMMRLKRANFYPFSIKIGLQKESRYTNKKKTPARTSPKSPNSAGWGPVLGVVKWVGYEVPVKKSTQKKKKIGKLIYKKKKRPLKKSTSILSRPVPSPKSPKSAGWVVKWRGHQLTKAPHSNP